MKNISCSLDRSCFGTFWVILLSFLVLSLLVQSCRLNQNVLAQAVSMNQRGQGETNRLNLPDREVTDKPSFKSSIPQSAIQNLSSTSIGDPQSKAEVVRKTAKLQMPFIANKGQTDAKVAFYANTFGGTVFVTKDGNIVYSLPHTVAHATPLVHYDIDKNETGHTGLTGFPGKEGQCIVHRTLCAMYPYCPWNFPVYYSETNSPLKKGTHPLIPSREGNGVCNTTPTTRRDTERRVPTTTVALKEQFVGAKVKTIQGEERSVTKVNYFKGKDPSKWKTDISTYDVINLGEVYDGVELKLKAYGDNVEKLFYVKPGADPDQIKIKLSGAKDCGVQNAECGIKNPKSEFQNPKLWVNEHGELEVETELGPVKFTRPVAYQEIDGKRVEIECGYVISDCGIQEMSDVGWVKRSAPNRNGLNQLNGLESRGKRLISSREKGMGRKGAYITSNLQPSTSNPKLVPDSDLSTTQSGDRGSAIRNLSSTSIGDPKLEYGFKVASYDRTKDLIIDPLLASTYLGGSGEEYGQSITLDTSGNVWVTGRTQSTDFPTTSGVYGTSQNGSYDVFVSKLDSYLSASPTPTPVIANSWTQKADFPSTGMREPLSFSIGNKGYVGITETNGGREFWEYNPSTDLWIQKADLPSTGFLFQSPSFVINDKAYVVIGNQVWEYNPDTDQWLQKEDIPGEDKMAGFGFAIGNKGYLGGGFYNGNEFWEYDSTNDQWNQKNGHPKFSVYYNDDNYYAISGVTFSIDNKGYVTGTNMDFWEYDPANDSWTKKAYLYAPYGQAFSIRQKGYVFNTKGELYEYEPSSNQWTTKASFPGDKICYPAGFSINGKGYIGLGGLFQGNTCTLTPSNDFWEYTPDEGTVAPTSTPSPTPTPADTTPPSGSISINSGSTYTKSTSVTLSLSASDSTGVTGYYLSASSTKPSSGNTGWSSISSTTSYSASVSYTLSSGDGSKTVYVWYKDEAGNVSDTASDSITLDTTAPTVTITSPTSDATFITTNSTNSLSGSATDSTSGISSVKWSNSNGESGMASGTTNWSISSINLSSGDNMITVIATDNAGNSGKDTITVTYATYTLTPTPKVTPSPTITLTSTPTVTPTTTLLPVASPTPAVCEPESIEISLNKMVLKRKVTREVTVMVLGENSCPVENETIYVEVNASGKRRVSVTPSSQVTDENGEAVFTLTAKNRAGNAKVTFKAGSLEKSMIVKVRK